MITPIPKETEAPAIVAMRELVDSLEPALTDLAVEDYAPPQEFTAHEDGTVTLD